MMRIVNKNELAINPIQVISEIDIPKCEIILNGKLSGKIYLGSVLEAAIQWGDFYLIFLTYSVPYEHMLNIFLLKNDLNLIDSANLSSIHPAGPFSSLQLIEPNTVNFRFINETEWQIKLLQKPALSIPFFTSPLGISRKFGWKKHFTISRIPKLNGKTK